MALRASGGILLVISFGLFAYNIFATVIIRKEDIQPSFLVKHVETQAIGLAD